MNRFETGSRGFRRAGLMLIQAAALALVVAMAMPSRAAEDRAVKSRTNPVYPEVAKRMKIGGLVVIEATVDAEGRVTAVKTVSGNKLLAPAAEDAVRTWKFVPGSGQSTVNVDINFAMAQ